MNLYEGWVLEDILSRIDREKLYILLEFAGMQITIWDRKHEFIDSHPYITSDGITVYSTTIDFSRSNSQVVSYLELFEELKLQISSQTHITHIK